MGSFERKFLESIFLESKGMVYGCDGKAIDRLCQFLIQSDFQPLNWLRVAGRIVRTLCVAVLGLISGGLLAQAMPAGGVNGVAEVSSLRIDATGKEKSITTVEEDRLPSALNAMPELRVQIGTLKASWSVALAASDSAADLFATVERQALGLWREHSAAVAERAPFDDRGLYWQRLAIAPLVRARADVLGLTAAECATLIKRFEQASRGQTDIRWQPSSDLKVLMTGFDPFSLDRRIDQSNPSGLIALALDGQQFEVAGHRVEINSALFPVRYGDFDADILEDWLQPIFQSTSLGLFVSVSMGRDQFDLERFPGRRRSSAALGNLREHTGGSQASPQPPLYRGKPIDGAEFVEFSLPAAAMQLAEGAFQIRDNRRVTTLERGSFIASSLGMLQDQTAVLGSGGGYLSNEISYRSIRLASNLNLDLPMGHIHTPSVFGHDPARSTQMLKQVEAMVVRALKSEKGFGHD